MTIVFTNFSGIYNANVAPSGTTAVGFGLYNSGQVFPLGGGLFSESSGNATGGVQDWEGYMAFVSDTTSSLHDELFSRPSNASNGGSGNQDLVTQGSGTKSFLNAVEIGGVGTPSTVPASTNIVYTNVLTRCV